MNQPRPNSFAIPSREFITEQQATVILASIREVGIWMAKSEDMVPGEARTAAENTFIKLCDRLDQIVADEKRWSVEGTLCFYDEMVKTQKTQQDFLITQTEAVSLVLRPSYIHRPAIMRDETRFYAVWGDGSRPELSITGVGATPNEALADFDAAFDRAPKDQFKEILSTETPEETPEETPPNES